MARYAGSGKTTVESCRCIDVLDWHRRGCLRSPRRFSWAWRQDGEQVASINVETERHRVTVKYRNRRYGGDWESVKQQFTVAWTPCRFGGERPWFVCSVYANGTYCGRQVTKLYQAGHLFACRHCSQLDYASQQESAMNVGYGRHRQSGCDWVGPLTCSMISRKGRKACIGGPTSAYAACMMQRKRIQLLD
jgi:hypothetical protein